MSVCARAVVLSVIKSFIIQLKFLCNANNDCVDSCDSNGDDVLLFLHHVNNKSSALFFSWRIMVRSRLNVGFRALMFSLDCHTFTVFSLLLLFLLVLLVLQWLLVCAVAAIIIIINVIIALVSTLNGAIC